MDAPLHCEHLECSATFRSKRALAQHIEEAHAKKQFVCQICKTDFGRKAGLKRHLAAVHTVNIQNEGVTCRCECGNVFLNLQGLMSHRSFCDTSEKYSKRSEYTIKQKRAAVKIIKDAGIDTTPTKIPDNVKDLIRLKTKLSPRAARRAFVSRKKLFAKKKTFTQKAESLTEADSLETRDKKLFGSVKSKNERNRSGMFKRLPGGGRNQDDWWIRIKTELRKEFLMLREELLAEVDTTLLLEFVFKVAADLNINLNDVLSDTSDPRECLYKRLLNFLKEYNLAREKSNQQSHISLWRRVFELEL